ncbi:MAG: winged helix DNA-binding protein [Chitinophagaceae bacterium]|nr:winged helix DNA-binding protein [Chitinophagaceae bacterium]
MSLENDINQPKFRNDFQKSTINLIYTYNWMNEQMKKLFGSYEVTGQQYNILRILRGAGKPLSTLQIRQRMLDKMSDTSRIVDRLVLKELVKKTDCEHDKRLVDIVITDRGQQLLEEMDKHQETMDKIMMNISEEEAKTLNHLLDKIRNS